MDWISIFFSLSSVFELFYIMKLSPSLLLDAINPDCKENFAFTAYCKLLCSKLKTA